MADLPNADQYRHRNAIGDGGTDRSHAARRPSSGRPDPDPSATEAPTSGGGGAGWAVAAGLLLLAALFSK